MRYLLIFVALAVSVFAGAQSFSAVPAAKESDFVAITVTATMEPDFVVESCYWYVHRDKKREYEQRAEGCTPATFSLATGTYVVELVVNGREKKYAHLAIDQRHISKTITVRPRVLIEENR